MGIMRLTSLWTVLLALSVSRIPAQLDGENCEEVVKQAVRRANAIFTGKVEAIQNGTSSVVIKVKRVFKVQMSGEAEGNRVAVLEDWGVAPGSRVSIRLPGTPSPSSARIMSCLGLFAPPSPALPLRLRDTKLFFARLAPTDNRDVDTRVETNRDVSLPVAPLLDLAPLPMTLAVLDRISAAVKDVTYKPRPHLLEEPCEKRYCEYGASCVVDEGGNSVCRCPSECPPALAPVCGTDSKSYSNLCALRMASCIAKQNIRVQHPGECEVTDPCAERVCPWGARCAPSADGLSATCQCPDKCPNYGDHSASRTLCGTDGVDYQDQCQLRRAACVNNTEIRVKFIGQCDPCGSATCVEPEVCQLDPERRPVCRCGDACSLEFTPVCGSDGKTYSNECSLRQQSCRSRNTLRIIYRGKCSSGVNPCSSVSCSHGEECVINKFGIAECSCPPECEPVVRPVCGSDANTYDSVCHLNRVACGRKATIQVAHTGFCGSNGPCASHKCAHGGVCVERAGLPLCECPHCPSEFAPVCGSDGISYGNECKLRLEACQHMREITVLYNGLCNGCVNKKCDFFSVCESDGTGEARCICPTTCPEVAAAVCGTDGITYKNDCLLKRTACETKQPTQLSYKGDCDLCQDVQCKLGAHCVAGVCICPTECGHQDAKESVCASDLRTYTSECEMQRQACLTKPPISLSVLFYGECKERFAPAQLSMEVKPCNGEKPVEDPVTGLELDCGNGPKRQDCPSDSYCHQTPNFARCCRKDAGVYLKSCEDSWFGCCPDLKTPAQGPENAGCPSMCGCNKLGSFSDTCDPENEQCSCKPGVGGLKCDRCEPGYWGLPKISSGHQGCLSCGCSLFGSVRDDCEQMTGRCVCKPGVQGQKCNTCINPKHIIGPTGCAAADVTTSTPTSCGQLRCYFGAVCEEREGQAKCTCMATCAQDSNTKKAQMVCGNDGQTYESECQLKLFACRYQKDIAVQVHGPCKEDMFVGTEWPLRQWTNQNLRFTEPEDVSSPLSKSTRHLLIPDHRYYYSSRERTGDHTPHTLGRSKELYHVKSQPTPATVQVFTALLGDLCSLDTDCTIRHSICIAGACTCGPDYAETPDRQDCLGTVPVDPTAELQACDSKPCLNGGTCSESSEGPTFTCLCQIGFTGEICADILPPKEYDIPAFNGNSWVRLKKLKAYHKLSLEVEFKTYANDGILFYNQQRADGTGDFVSLAIVNGFVEFRYNLGNGPVVLTSLERVERRKFHKVSAKRYMRDGLLQLDNGEAVAGQSQGSLRALDLDQDAFIGFIPTTATKVFENVGTSMGLIGCIRRVKVGRKVVELHAGRDEMVEQTQGVSECGENPCASLPCHNGATCHPIDAISFTCACYQNFTGKFCEVKVNPCISSPCAFGSTCDPLPHGGFTCKCLPGRNGASCQHYELVVDYQIPEFFGGSYLELPRLEGVSRAFNLELWFRPTAPNGTLLYNGQLTSGRGDFIVINLVDGHVQFSFNLGSGAANIMTEEVVELNRWCIVKASRLDKEGVLQLNNGTIATGSSGPPLNELNLELPLYIGGVPNMTTVNRESGVTSGFAGAVQRVLVNGQVWGEIGDWQNGFGVTRYQGVPCPPSDSPCLNMGACLPILDTFICKCANKYTGDLCQHYAGSSEAEGAVRFNGKNYLQYPKRLPSLHKRRKGKRANRYELSLKTTEKYGLLLWTNKGHSLLGDYLGLALVDGFAQLSFNLGKQQNLLTVISKVMISDGEWHRILVTRRKRLAQLQVDRESPIKAQANLGATLLTTNARLWIGGAPSLPPGLPEGFYINLRGCVEQMIVDRRAVNLLRLNGSQHLEMCEENDV